MLIYTSELYHMKIILYTYVRLHIGMTNRTDDLDAPPSHSTTRAPLCFPAVDDAEEWSRGMGACFSNCGLCVMAYLCPCVVFGRVARHAWLGDDCCICCCCGMLWLCGCVGLYARARTRGRLRATYSLKVGSTFLLLSSSPTQARTHD